MRLKDLLSHIDSDSKGDLIAIARTLLAGNLGEDATQQELVALLDDLLPWEDFIKGPVGGIGWADFAAGGAGDRQRCQTERLKSGTADKCSTGLKY